MKETPLPDTKTKKNRIKYRLTTGCDPTFTQLRKDWYPNGTGDKVATRDYLDQLDSFGLAVWYMDDGQLSINDNAKFAYFHTESFGVDGNLIIKEWVMDSLGIVCNLSKDSRGYIYIRFCSSEYRKLFPLIKDYIHPTMYYKIPPEYRE